jgi:hypothetical protein
MSITLMLLAFYIMWGAALVVYNQSKVAASSQFAAQGALLVYDRSTYRGGYPTPGYGSDGGAYTKAREAAQSLVTINGSAGLAADGAANPVVAMTRFDINCGSSITGTVATGAAGGSEGSACVDTLASSDGAQVTRVEVDTSAAADAWLLQPFANSSSNAGLSFLTSRTAALSAGPNATP